MIRVTKIVSHKKYSDITYDYDFAVLELAKVSDFPSSAAFVTLPKKKTPKLRTGEIMIVTGWGDTLNSQESEQYLRAAEVPIYDQKKCKKDYRAQITKQMICAGFPEGGTKLFKNYSAILIIAINSRT